MLPAHFSDAASALISAQQMWIDGKWVTGQGEFNVSIDPYTEAAIAPVPAATAAQVEGAIGAARQAFDDGRWRQLPASERSAILHRLADLIEEHAPLLTQIFVAEGGCPISLARVLNGDVPVKHMRWLADKVLTGPRGGWEQDLPADSWSNTAGKLVHEPIGVAAALAPYNVPYIAYVWKVGTALATGCSVILMPSPRTQLTGLAFAKLVEQAGVPAGVFNFVFGNPAVGQQLSEDPRVDMISFTGSNAVGAQVMQQGAATAKRVLLELGGKSPNIILPDTPVENIVEPSLRRLYRNAGQGCAVTSRTLVPRQSFARYAELAREVMPTIQVGDPWQEDTWVGPLIRAEHRDRVEQFVIRAVQAGGDIEAGGGRPSDQPHGFFMNPVLLSGLSMSSEIAQEELFGPVGVMFPYDSIDEMVALANDSRYGLNANIWGDKEQAIDIARRIQSGTVTINGGGQFRADAPFGGYKQSGNGREMGEQGFMEFLETKHISWPLT